MNEIHMVLLNFLLYFIIMGLISFVQYHNKEESFINSLKKISILSKILVLLIIVFSISLITAISISPHTLPKANNASGELYNITDVNDGVVVVGRTKRPVSDGGSFTCTTSRGFIAKYSYDGDLIWENFHYDTNDICNNSSFYKVELLNNGNLLVTGSFEIEYGDNESTITYSQDGEFVSKSEDSINHSLIEVENNLSLFIHSHIIEQGLNKLELVLFNDSDEIINQIDYLFENRIVSTYNYYEPSFTILQYTDDLIIIGLYVHSLDDENEIYYSSLLVLDYELNIVNEIELDLKYVPRNIFEIEEKLYLSSYNQWRRESYLILLDNQFTPVTEYKIEGNLDYVKLGSIKITDDEIIIGATEYETVQKYGFTEYYSGFINIYDLNMQFKERITMTSGVGINNLLIINDKIYTVGLFNSTYGFSSISGKTDYPWCGVFAIVNRDKDLITVEDFT